jgi:hypothetical protein
MRCYNGTPDSELQAYLDTITQAEKKLRSLVPEAHCTYHAPHAGHGSFWQVHVWGKPIGRESPTHLGALHNAISQATLTLLS